MYNLGLTTKLLLLTILLVSIPVVIIFSSTTTTRLQVQTNSKTHSNSLHIHDHVRIAHPSACDNTLYPELCVSTLATVPDQASKSISDLVIATLNKTMYEVRASSYNCSKIQHKSRNLDRHGRVALNDCLELLDGTLSELKSAISNLELEKSALSEKHYHRLQTLLSGAMTNQYTCLDGFAYSKEKGVRNAIKKRLRKISRHVSNSLVMLKKIPGVKSSASDPHPHDLQYGNDMKHRFPTWLTSKDRKLLQAPFNQTKPDLIVAKDGTGNFTTISAAVDAAPNSSVTRFVIYIKAGAYFENVEVEKKKKMLMFLGDGIGKTVVKANRSVVDGWTTFRSATVAVVGNGFIAKGITFENSAGPSKHQAVALRVGADLSAFYQCSFVAYQDTLYVHSLRQFFRECDVYGTVDFIFGNAAVVFQNCNLYARKPDPNQKNIFTAQGREDPNQNTGISIINCKVAAAADLIPVKSSFKTYLGRPWKEYSRTVFIRSNIEDVVDPAGWLEWNGTFALSTLYYGEYMNRGLGSNTTRRVTWPGYRVINSSTEASKFTVGTFIQGNEWLNATAVNGAGFLAKGITIENTAGPNKGQAVAFRSNSDFSAFYQCSFLAFQDTLYTHSYQQFYRECDVFGTVDFIFGNAAVVFQNCNLFARRPNKHQYNTLTAQGRKYKHENTGISIINCTITAADDLVPVKSKIKTYLGRPWRKYSRTVILNSYIDDLVEPDGWSKWDGSFALKTLYYGEYNNRGPGSDTSSRVTWPGYQVIREPSEARKFTVGSLIHGDEWLNSTGIPYFLDLEEIND